MGLGRLGGGMCWGVGEGFERGVGAWGVRRVRVMGSGPLVCFVSVGKAFPPAPYIVPRLRSIISSCR